ncbi:MAG: dipeptide ABC transporter ATP-binding protein [Thermodesulfobacteriota bacterium]
MTEAILEAQGLTKYYPLQGAAWGRRAGLVRAVDGVDLTVFEGEVFGLVGESGCGKSTLGRLMLLLEDPTSGRIFFQGRALAGLAKSDLKAFRRVAQIVYQDPYSSLDPRQKVGRIIEEPLLIHRIGSRNERRDRVAWLLEVVGLTPEMAERYPHEFSGGQRQRIAIARALALGPKLLLADEPVSALDVSIQAQILNLLKKLQAEFGLTYVFISHSLSVVEHLAQRVGVMYLGQMVEQASKAGFYANPLHPYSQALLSAAPVPDPTAAKQRIILEGDVPSPVNPPAGCSFHPRCPRRMEICRREKPVYREVGPGRFLACHLEVS